MLNLVWAGFTLLPQHPSLVFSGEDLAQIGLDKLGRFWLRSANYR